MLSLYELAELLDLPVAEKLKRLEALCPTDALAVEIIIDDCLTRRWPRDPREFLRLVEPA